MHPLGSCPAAPGPCALPWGSLQLDQREPIVLRLFRLLLLLRGRRLLWLLWLLRRGRRLRRGTLGLLRPTADRSRRVRLVQRAVVDAPRRARHAFPARHHLHRDARPRRRRTQRTAVLG